MTSFDTFHHMKPGEALLEWEGNPSEGEHPVSYWFDGWFRHHACLSGSAGNLNSNSYELSS